MVKEFLIPFFNKNQRRIINNKVDNKQILIAKKITSVSTMCSDNLIFTILSIPNLELMHAFQSKLKAASPFLL